MKIEWQGINNFDEDDHCDNNDKNEGKNQNAFPNSIRCVFNKIVEKKRKYQKHDYHTWQVECRTLGLA